MTKNLIEGFKGFKRTHYDGADPLMPKLVSEGQKPDYFIISCIDSRANPGTIFNPLPGTFFAHKAMGAIVRPHKKGTALSAGLKFAIDHMNVSKVIVMGHTDCGAIKALVNNIPDEEINEFVSVAQDGLAKAKSCSCSAEDLQAKTEKEIIHLSIENLKTYPHVKTALDEGRVEIKGWLFDMAAGDILEYCEDTDDFKVITAGDK